VTYQFLAGRLPYEAQSLTELALKQQREVPASLDELDPSIPHGVAQAVARALELEPAQRYASADEMREALSAGAAGETFDDEPTARTSVLAGDPTLSTRIASPSAEPAAGARRLQPTPGAPAPPPSAQRRPVDAEPGAGRGRRVAATLLLLALVAALAVGAYLAFSSGSGEVQLQQVEYETVGESVDAMKELVDSNTR
jgi:serine/threonine-protein kinase